MGAVTLNEKLFAEYGKNNEETNEVNNKNTKVKE